MVSRGGGRGGRVISGFMKVSRRSPTVQHMVADVACICRYVTVHTYTYVHTYIHWH